MNNDSVCWALLRGRTWVRLSITLNFPLLLLVSRGLASWTFSPRSRKSSRTKGSLLHLLLKRIDLIDPTLILHALALNLISTLNTAQYRSGDQSSMGQVVHRSGYFTHASVSHRQIRTISEGIILELPERFPAGSKARVLRTECSKIFDFPEHFFSDIQLANYPGQSYNTANSTFNTPFSCLSCLNISMNFSPAFQHTQTHRHVYGKLCKK